MIASLQTPKPSTYLQVVLVRKPSSVVTEVVKNREVIEVSPGEEKQYLIHTTLVSDNISTLPVNFEVTVDGVSGVAWCKLDAFAHTLYSGHPHANALRIAPPLAPMPEARDYELRVKVTPQESGVAAASIENTIHVKPFERYEAYLEPEHQVGTLGVYSVTIANAGNSEIRFALRGEDHPGTGVACRYEFDDANPSVKAGETREVQLVVSPARWPDTGSNWRHTFTVVVKPDAPSLKPDSLSGRLEVLPPYEVELYSRQDVGATGHYMIAIKNNWGADIEFALSCADALDSGLKCKYRLGLSSLRATPGKIQYVSLDVLPHQRPVRGPSRHHSFVLTVAPHPRTQLPSTIRLGKLEVPPRPMRWLLLFAMSTLLLGAGGLLAWLLLQAPAPPLKSEFAISPQGQAIIRGIVLPYASGTQIDVSVDWRGSPQPLDLALARPFPANSELSTKRLLPSATHVTFVVEGRDLAYYGLSGWRLRAENASSDSQANGTIRLTFSRFAQKGSN